MLYSVTVKQAANSAQESGSGQKFRRNIMHRGIEWLFSVQVVWSIAAAAGLLPGPDRPWLDLMLLGTAVVLSLLSLAKNLPLQNVLAAAAVLILVSGGIQACLFLLHFGQSAVGISPALLLVALPALWVVAAIVCRTMAKQTLQPWRQARTHGYHLLVLTSLLMTAFWFCIDAYAESRGYWDWERSWRGDLIYRLLFWFCAGAALQIIATPWLLNKRPRVESPVFSPVLVWTGILLWLALAEALAGLRNYGWLTGVVAAVGAILFTWCFQRRCPSSA